MTANKFTDEFKRDAVAQVTARGYPVREGAERLGVRCPAGECAAIADGHCTMICVILAKTSAPWRLAGIRAQIGYKKTLGSYDGSPAVVADNTLNREFDVDAPDQFCLSAIEGNRPSVTGHRYHLHPHA